MSLGGDTFNLNKTQFKEKLGKIIGNFRANSRVIGEPRDFILRACRLTTQWGKMANDPEITVYLRNWDIAAGRKVKMVVLEKGGFKQPVPKAKLLDALYPPRKNSEKVSAETRHYHMVKTAMRGGIVDQLKEYRDSIELPVTCSLTEKKIRPGMKTDVDHVGMSFSEIADNFLREKFLKFSAVILKGPPTAKVFADQELWEEWKNYHREKARFALVCASANRSKGAEDYSTPQDLLGSFEAKDPEDLSLDF